jgi:hypothetical protein
MMATTDIATATAMTLKELIISHPYILIPVLVLLVAVYNKFCPGLISIPGPPLAAYTNIWRVLDVASGKTHLTAIQLHKKYGPIVRTGPRHVSISDPTLIPVIYSTNGRYTKTGFYPLQAISWKRKPVMNIFSSRDEEWHRMEKRRLAPAYTVGNLSLNENAMDGVIEMFMKRLGEVGTGAQRVDLGDWIEFFTFDFMAEITYARKMGFLEQGEDIKVWHLSTSQSLFRGQSGSDFAV